MADESSFRKDKSIFAHSQKLQFIVAAGHTACRVRKKRLYSPHFPDQLAVPRQSPQLSPEVCLMAILGPVRPVLNVNPHHDL